MGIPNKTKLLIIEAPEQEAEIDFLHHKLAVTVTVTPTGIEITAKKFSDDAYQWQEGTATIDL